MKPLTGLLVVVLWFAFSTAISASLAAEPKVPNGDRAKLAALRRTVEQGYAKLDHFTLACFAYAADTKQGKPDRSLYFGGMGYAFDRKTRRLAIVKQGEPNLLIQDRRLFLFLWEDAATGIRTYLEIVKERPITWDDVDEAEEMVRKQCPLASYERLAHCMILPLLKGGADRLFAGAIRVLKRGEEKEPTSVFVLGHPQYKITIGLPESTEKLDPRSIRAASAWRIATKLSFAVDSSGIESAVAGVAAREDVFGVPGNPVFIFKRNSGFNEKGQQYEKVTDAALDLPNDAKRIGVAKLKVAQLAAIKAEGIESLQSQLKQLEKVQKDNQKDEKLLQAKIAEARSSRTSADKLVELQAYLSDAQGRERTYDNAIPRIRGLLEDVQRTETKSQR